MDNSLQGLTFSFRHLVASHGGLDHAELNTNFGLHLRFTVLKENNPARDSLGFPWCETLSPCCAASWTKALGCARCGNPIIEEQVVFLSGSACPLDGSESRQALSSLCRGRLDALETALTLNNLHELLNHILGGEWAWGDIEETNLDSFVSTLDA